MLCLAHPQFGITFPPSYLNVCHVITLQLYKVSKNIAYPWLKYPNNVQLSHDIHNIQKLVFVLNRFYILLYSQIYNSAKTQKKSIFRCTNKTGGNCFEFTTWKTYKTWLRSYDYTVSIPEWILCEEWGCNCCETCCHHKV